MSDGMQTQVYGYYAPGVAGDFCDMNPRYTVDAGPGGLVAGPLGLYVGRFAWVTYQAIDWDNAPAIANNFGVGNPAGFVHRAQQGLNTIYLQDASMLVPEGFPVTVHSGGGFWAVNSGTTQAYRGQKAYANFASGLVSFAASGSPPGGGTSTASSIAAETFSVTGSITGNILTVTAVSSGTIYNGATISGTGVASGTEIVAQLTGTTGGVGTYAVSLPEQTVASTTISGTYGLLTVGGTVAGTYEVGALLSGTDVVTGTQITALGTGTGGSGTYIVNNNTVVSSTAIDATTTVETQWYAASSGAPGEIVKMTDRYLG